MERNRLADTLRSDANMALDMAHLYGLRGDKLMTDYFIGLASRLEFVAMEVRNAPVDEAGLPPALVS